MKTIGILALFCTAAAFSPGQPAPALIPAPLHLETRPGVFTLGPDTHIYTDKASYATGAFLAEQLRQATGYALPDTKRFFASGSPIKGAILLTTRGVSDDLGAEGYELEVTPDSIVIRAPAQAGVFYGVQTLLQLLPTRIFSPNVVNGVAWTVPSVRISDQPRFRWRGLMLDVARHFFDKYEVERLLDEMALHKLNTFHWHLADDQGWRIEIKKYPKLTQVGAWRSGIGFDLDPKATSAYDADKRYGGFYTQDDIREVVNYAAIRHITVVPEIEMPGHSTAALSAYPQFSCTGGPFTPPLKGGVFNGIYDPAKEETFTFLEDVLTEVFDLFPSKLVHIGGDEVPKTTWKSSPDCQALMQREGLKNEEELQSWFIRRIEKFVNAHGHTLIGWSEILQGGLAKNAIVMDWIGGGKEAAASGHNAIMTPQNYLYLDHYQSANRAVEPHANGGKMVTLQTVYDYEPIPADLPEAAQHFILGAQGNLWTEYVPNFSRVEYMMWPRACALAEVDWSAKGARNWDDFKARLAVQEKRLDEWNVNYRRDSGPR